MLNVAPIIVLLIASQERIQQVNPYFERLTGWSGEELRGRDWFEHCIPPRERGRLREQFRRTLQEALKGGGDVSPILKRGGDELEIEWTYQTLRGPEGRIGGLLAVGVDVTDRRRAEKALAERENKFRGLATDIADGIYAINSDGVVTFANPALARLTGFQSPDEVIGKSLRDFLAPSVVEEEVRAFQRAIESGKTRESKVVQLRRPSGELFMAEVRSRVIRDGERVAELVGTIRDVTETKRAEESLRKSEARLREAQRIAGIGSWELELPTNTLIWSDEVYRIFEVDPNTPSELHRQVFENAIHPDDREMVQRAYEESIATRKPYDIVHRLQTPSGKIKYVRERCETMYDDAGRPVLSVGTVQDITERVLADESLRSVELRNRTIIRGSLDGYWRVGTNARILEVNDAYCRMSGYSEEELLKLSVLDLEAQETPEEIAERVRTVINAGVARFETQHRRKDGSVYPVEVRVQYLPLEGGQFVGFLRDLSERKKAEQESKQLREALAHSQRVGMLSELASGLAHELNQPLGAIHLTAEAALLLGQQFQCEPLQSSLKRIAEQSHRAGEIVRRIRSFIRQDATPRKPHDVNELVREVLMLLRDTLHQGEVKFELDLAEGLPPVQVDGIQIQQVLVNLVRNADEAMAENGEFPRVLSIGTRLVDDDLHVSVSDTGCGLDPAIADKLFFPFQTTKGMGLGLGLVTCRTIVESHGGRIWANANPDRGMTFTLSLPVTG